MINKFSVDTKIHEKETSVIQFASRTTEKNAFWCIGTPVAQDVHIYKLLAANTGDDGIINICDVETKCITGTGNNKQYPIHLSDNIQNNSTAIHLKAKTQ